MNKEDLQTLIEQLVFEQDEEDDGGALEGDAGADSAEDEVGGDLGDLDDSDADTDLETSIDDGDTGGAEGEDGMDDDIDTDMGGSAGGGGFSGGGGGMDMGGDDDLGDDEEGDEEETDAAAEETEKEIEDPVQSTVDQAWEMLENTNDIQEILNQVKADVQTKFDDLENATPVISALYDTDNIVLQGVARRLLLFLQGS